MPKIARSRWVPAIGASVSVLITDHRIGLTIHSLTQVMEGELDEVIETLQSEDQKLKLDALISAQLGT